MEASDRRTRVDRAIASAVLRGARDTTVELSLAEREEFEEASAVRLCVRSGKGSFD